MCLLIFAHRAWPQRPLVVAANRDEFHARPTAPADFWAEQPALLAGRDLEAGGTWMGVTRNGRFAAITNYRDPARTAPALRSRGELPVAFLTGQHSPQDYLHQVAQQGQDYAGFNLLAGDLDSLWYLTNSDDSGPASLAPGIYGLSNARLDTPWPKVERGKARMGQLIDQQLCSHDDLGSAVTNKQLADPQALTGLGLDSEMDQVLSAQFITTGTYGTRACTTLLCSDAGQISWQEQSFDAMGDLTRVQRRDFGVEARQDYSTGA